WYSPGLTLPHARLFLQEPQALEQILQAGPGCVQPALELLVLALEAHDPLLERHHVMAGPQFRALAFRFERATAPGPQLLGDVLDDVFQAGEGDEFRILGF